MSSSHLILCHPLLLLPSIFPSIRVFSSESALPIRWSKYWRFSFSNHPSNEYSGLIPFRIEWLIYLQSKGLSRVSPAPQFESISSSALSLLHSPNFTAVQDYWKSHNFDYMQLCQQSDVSTFSYTAYVSYNFTSKEQVSFDFMAAVTTHSNFGAQENKICHYFHTSPFCLP